MAYYGPTRTSSSSINDPVGMIHSGDVQLNIRNSDGDQDVPPRVVPELEQPQADSSYALGKPEDLHVGLPHKERPPQLHAVVEGKKPAHLRWKTGCFTCRKRRIKCDDVQPVCRNCTKSKRYCEGYDAGELRRSYAERQTQRQRSASFSHGGDLLRTFEPPGSRQMVEPLATDVVPDAPEEVHINTVAEVQRSRPNTTSERELHKEHDKVLSARSSSDDYTALPLGSALQEVDTESESDVGTRLTHTISHPPIGSLMRTVTLPPSFDHPPGSSNRSYYQDSHSPQPGLLCGQEFGAAFVDLSLDHSGRRAAQWQSALGWDDVPNLAMADIPARRGLFAADQSSLLPQELSRDPQESDGYIQNNDTYVSQQYLHGSGSLVSSKSSKNPPLIRTSILQESRVATAAMAATPAFNPYLIHPAHPKAMLKIEGDLNIMACDWTASELQVGRRLVQFRRSQRGSVITATFEAVALEDRLPNNTCVSCIWWEAKQECYVTSVDAVSLLAFLVGVRFTVEENNRIRRNLEGFRPATVSKTKTESEDFYKLIVGFPDPRPRNIEKDQKVFPWRIFGTALKKIIGKYSASHAEGSSMPLPWPGSGAYLSDEKQKSSMTPKESVAEIEAARSYAMGLTKSVESLEKPAEKLDSMCSSVAGRKDKKETRADDDDGFRARPRSTMVTAPKESTVVKSAVDTFTSIAEGPRKKQRSGSSTPQRALPQAAKLSGLQQTLGPLAIDVLSDSRKQFTPSGTLGRRESSSSIATTRSLFNVTDVLKHYEQRLDRLLNLTRPASPLVPFPGSSDEGSRGSSESIALRFPSGLPTSATATDCSSRSKSQPPSRNIRQLSNPISRTAATNTVQSTSGNPQSGASGGRETQSTSRKRQRSSHSGRSGDRRGSLSDSEGNPQQRQRLTSQPSAQAHAGLPCIFYAGQPEIYARCGGQKHSHISLLQRHLHTHGFYVCSKCFMKFGEQAEKKQHEQLHTNRPDHCNLPQCRRYRQSGSQTTSDACVKSTWAQWQALFRVQYPHRDLPGVNVSSLPTLATLNGYSVQSSGNMAETTAHASHRTVQHPAALALPMHSGESPRESRTTDTVTSSTELVGMEFIIPDVNYLNGSFPGVTPAKDATSFAQEIRQMEAVLPSTENADMAPMPLDPGDLNTLFPIGDPLYELNQRLSTKIALLEQRLIQPDQRQRQTEALFAMVWEALEETRSPKSQPGSTLHRMVTEMLPGVISTRATANMTRDVQHVPDMQNSTPLFWQAEKSNAGALPNPIWNFSDNLHTDGSALREDSTYGSGQ